MAGQLVGRREEIRSLERMLDELDGGRAGAVAVVGEPGVGKTRLLDELRARAEGRGHLVLVGSAAELERDLPFSVFLDALDEYVAGLDRDTFAGLDQSTQTELAHVFPSLWELERGQPVASQPERYRSHRAVRALLERLARPTRLVLVLDDFQWADPASVELLGALLRRPAGGEVFMAVALRSLPDSDRLSMTLERAQRSATIARIELGTLTPTEARRLIGDDLGSEAMASLYEETGGNPFYLEQLARQLGGGSHPGPDRHAGLTGIGVPAAVVAALAEELTRLSEITLQVFEGAAVAGDPFELELAAAAAGIPEATAINAVDDLLKLGLLRSTDAPRRFRFRHPLVRRAAYEGALPGWRVRAHQRCADALARRGASASARAHHIERSARCGDRAAIDLLRKAGDDSLRLAPASSARWFGAALRLIPDGAPAEDLVDLHLARAGALAASGHFNESHGTLLAAIDLVTDRSTTLFSTLATACARQERFIGRYEQARTRLLGALERRSGPPSQEAVGLLIELTLNEFYRSRYDAMGAWAGRAVESAAATGDQVLLAVALSMATLSDAVVGSQDSARSRCAETARVVDGLSDDELAVRIDAAAWLAASELYLDLYADADRHASRALAIGRATGYGDPFGLYQILPRVWLMRGKLGEATEILDGAIEAGRLLGTPPAVAGNLFNRSAVAVAVGDLRLAEMLAEEAAELVQDLGGSFVAAWAAVRLAAVRLEAGRPTRAIDLLLGEAGGEDLSLIPGSWRAYCLELLTRCQLAADRHEEATRTAEHAVAAAKASGLPLPRAWAERAASSVALSAGDTSAAVGLALASAEGADAIGAPIEAALSRELAGKALAAGGRRGQAVIELTRAAAVFDDCGALRYRERAERELARLGRRLYRRTRPGRSGAVGVVALSERELEVARLVVDRKTNPEIAAELFLSQKTVESHLRNAFNKVGVDSRAALARAVERAADVS